MRDFCAQRTSVHKRYQIKSTAIKFFKSYVPLFSTYNNQIQVLKSARQHLQRKASMFRNKNETNVAYKCIVRLLDDFDVVECEFQNSDKGKFLLDSICARLGIKEKDYFGLRYIDKAHQRQWLDNFKYIAKQCKDIDPIVLSLRVKFYPADPFRFSGVARVMLYKQLKRDLKHGRLYCNFNEAVVLGSLIVQEELGDYNEIIHTNNYICHMQLLLRQSEILEKAIMEMHKQRKPNQDKLIVIDEFMALSKGLDGYGIDPYPVKDHRGTQLYVGVNYAGISTFALGKRSQHFRWHDVQKLNYEGRMLIIHLCYTDSCKELKKYTIGLKSLTTTACRCLWRCAIEQMLFFTLPDNQNTHTVSGGGLFSWGSKFKYYGRTEREIITASINALREQKNSLKKKKASSVPTSPSSLNGDITEIRYNSLPRAAMSEHDDRTSIHADYCRNNVRAEKSYFPLRAVEEEIQFPIQDSNIIRRFKNEDCYQKLKNSSDSFGVFLSSIFNSNNCSTSNSYYCDLNKEMLPVQKSSKDVSPLSLEDRKVRPSDSLRTCLYSKRKFNVTYAFILSIAFSVCFLCLLFIWIMESDCQLSIKLRDMPEIITLNYHYYQFIKKFVLSPF